MNGQFHITWRGNNAVRANTSAFAKCSQTHELRLFPQLRAVREANGIFRVTRAKPAPRYGAAMYEVLSVWHRNEFRQNAVAARQI